MNLSSSALIFIACLWIWPNEVGAQLPTPKNDNNSDRPAATQASIDDDLRVIDVRSPEEFAANSIENSVNIDVNDSSFKLQLGKLDKTKNYKLYCRSGRRSALAEKLMREEGFTRVENLRSLAEASKHLSRPCRKMPCSN